MNWFERHPGWTLLLVIICTPFILWGIFILLGLLALILPHSVGEALIIGVASVLPIGYIVIVILGVRWYRKRKRQNDTSKLQF